MNGWRQFRGAPLSAGQTRAGRRFVFRPLTAVLVGAAVTAWAESAPVREAEVKAVYLYHFAQFVEWPATAFAATNSPVVIGVLGEDPFGPVLDEAVRGETIKNRPLVVKRWRRLEEVQPCHILFICRSELGQLSAVLRDRAAAGTLTVGESEQFAQAGGMIRLVSRENKVGFEINLDAAERAGLKIDAKLLQVAHVVSAPRRAKGR